MKAGLFRNTFIFLGCAVLMIYITLAGVVLSLFGLLTRARATSIIHHWAKAMLWLLNVKSRVHNPHNVDFTDGKRYLAMCNHSSLIDIPIVYANLHGSFRMVGKKELFKIPLFGRAMRAAEVVCIDRHDRQQAIADLAIAKQRMENGLVVWMFPEGTRSTDGKLLPLKKGGFFLAMDAEAHIVPVIIRGAHAILPKKSFRFRTGCEVSIHIGAPIDASQYTVDQKDELIAKVSQSMQSMLDA